MALLTEAASIERATLTNRGVKTLHAGIRSFIFQIFGTVASVISEMHATASRPAAMRKPPHQTGALPFVLPARGAPVELEALM